jgi:hypothetical protein
MIRCPYCNYELDYCETKVIDKTSHKFYNIYICPNENCVSKHEIITDCIGSLEIGSINYCYPEELLV